MSALTTRLAQLLGILVPVFMALILWASTAKAGVFNLPHFVDPGTSTFGVEPEATFTHGGGFAGNLRFQHGLTDLNNIYVLTGMGTGVRKFRVGAAMTFDFFPDVEKQPGIGIAVQGIYYRYGVEDTDLTYGQMEITAVPYVHKTFFNGEGQQIEPYLAVPVGPALRSGNHYHWMTNVVLGAMFKETASALTFNAEVGVAVKNSETYISGGLIFTP